MTGRALPPILIYVVGPSGAGKDSLLAWLRHHWPSPGGLHVARRTITRPVQAGAEQHEAVSEAEFGNLVSQGAFACHWQAHGFCYGIRVAELAPPAALCVCLSGSRQHLPFALRQWPHLQVLHVTAPADLIAQRLMLRGRDTAASVRARLSRPPGLPAMDASAVFEVCNDGSLAQAGQQVLTWLLHKVEAAS